MGFMKDVGAIDKGFWDMGVIWSSSKGILRILAGVY